VGFATPPGVYWLFFSVILSNIQSTYSLMFAAYRILIDRLLPYHITMGRLRIWCAFSRSFNVLQSAVQWLGALALLVARIVFKEFY
jgi:hypothetical protein